MSRHKLRTTRQNSRPLFRHPLQVVGSLIVLTAIGAGLAYAYWWIQVFYPDASRQPDWSQAKRMYTLIPVWLALGIASFGYALWEAPERGFRWGEVVGVVLSTVIGGLIVGWIIANAGR